MFKMFRKDDILDKIIETSIYCIDKDIDMFISFDSFYKNETTLYYSMIGQNISIKINSMKSYSFTKMFSNKCKSSLPIGHYLQLRKLWK